MFKTIAVVGLGAALALSPLAALAQAETPATPAAPQAQTNSAASPDMSPKAKKPMKHHTATNSKMKHTAKKTTPKTPAPMTPTAPAEAPKS